MMEDFYRFELLNGFKELFHAVSMKSKKAPYAFSLALHTGQKREEILQNRKKIEKLFNKKVQFIVANQTHSDHIEIIKEKRTQGWATLEDAVEDCDALITNAEDVVLAVLTADCVPILLYDKRKRVVAVVHAGWRGTKAKIVSKTVKKMREVYGCKNSDILAGVAPSIGRCCYEVGEEVAKHFFDMPESLTQLGEKYRLDLPLINKKQLLDAGVEERHIEMSNICTSCEVENFFSYRKEQGCSGRFMSLIGILRDEK